MGFNNCINLPSFLSNAGWHKPVIPAIRKLRQEDPKFKTNLGYILRLCLKRKKIL
jgi:hypothetical protein